MADYRYFTKQDHNNASAREYAEYAASLLINKNIAFDGDVNEAREREVIERYGTMNLLFRRKRETVHVPTESYYILKKYVENDRMGNGAGDREDHFLTVLTAQGKVLIGSWREYYHSNGRYEKRPEEWHEGDPSVCISMIDQFLKKKTIPFSYQKYISGGGSSSYHPDRSWKSKYEQDLEKRREAVLKTKVTGQDSSQMNWYIGAALYMAFAFMSFTLKTDFRDLTEMVLKHLLLFIGICAYGHFRGKGIGALELTVTNLDNRDIFYMIAAGISAFLHYGYTIEKTELFMVSFFTGLALSGLGFLVSRYYFYPQHFQKLLDRFLR